MHSVMLNLLVLKTRQVERLVAFYRTLGFDFAEEKHGNGPVHFAGRVGNMVFELYPTMTEDAVDSGTRLGFTVPDLDGIVAALGEMATPIESEPKMSPWGYRAVVRDPDGRAIELTNIDP